MAIGDCHRVVIHQDCFGQQIMNTLHYRVESVGTGDASQALAEVVDVDVATAFVANLSNQWAYIRTVAQRIFPGPVTFPQIDDTSTANGAVVSPAIPINAPVTITTQTGFAGTKWRGRIFVSGIPESYVADGEIENVDVVHLQEIATAISSVLTIGGWSFQPVLLHRADSTMTAIVQARANRTLRNMRRRQLGRGV